MTPEPSRARTIKPEPKQWIAGNLPGCEKSNSIYRIEAQLKGRPDSEIDWIPLEEYMDPVSADTRLKYWEHEFPFCDLFVFKVTEQCHPTKP